MDLTPGLNLVAGANGQGKSNLLEALDLLSVGKSFRGANDGDMVRWDAQRATVACSLHEGPVGRIEMAISQTDRKQITIDGAPAQPLSELLGTVRTVHLSPEVIDQQFRSPAGRRRMLDMLVSQGDRDYLAALRRHRQILQNLNALWKTGNPSEPELDVWELQLAREAVLIGGRRRRVLQDMESPLAGRFGSWFEGHTLSLRAHESLPTDAPEDAVGKCAEALRLARDQARRLGHVTKGAHRDRYEVLLDGRPIDVHGSQGQTKGAYFAWKLAEGDVLKDMTGSEPTWLVDDPFSEMDRERSLGLLDEFRERGQVILTSARDTDLDLGSRGLARWNVHNGTIERTI